MAKTRQVPDAEPKKRSRLFWICLLVLLEALLWTVLSVAGVNETVATIIALVGGVVFVIVYRDRIWGENWRAELEKSRARRPR